MKRDNPISNKFTVQKSFAISAGAGSGKTYTLSRRYINAILGFDFFIEYMCQQNFVQLKESKKADISQIVTITYTEAAALEMKDRIFELMSKIIEFDRLDEDDGDFKSISMAMALLSDEEKSYVKNSLEHALNNSNSAFISTIHSFCLNTIELNSDLARVDTQLAIIEDDEKKSILDEVRLEVLAQDESITLEIFQKTDKFKVNQLIENYTTNAKFRESFEKFIDAKEIDTQRYKAMIEELFVLPEIEDEIYAEIRNASDSEIRERWFESYVANFKAFDAKPWNSFKVEKKGKLSALSLGVKKFPYLSAFKEQMEALLPNYAPIDIQKEQLFSLQLKKLQHLLQKIYVAYTKRLDAQNKTDFDAIIAKTAEIVQKVEFDYKYIMVDEFQDTNTLQNSIIKEISKGKNLFVVGDSKQSIYSFQGAELEVFNNALNALNVEPMSINYRSDKKILSFVNDIFRELFEQEGSTSCLISSNFKARFTKDDELQPASLKKADGSVEFLLSKEEGYQRIDNQLQEIAKFIKAIKDGKMSGYEKITQLMQKKEKAVGILFDSSAKMLQLKRELNMLGIECKVSATENFYHTREINDIFLLLKSIELLKRKKTKELQLRRKEKFYIVGALRSTILRYNEREIIKLLEGDSEQIIAPFAHYIEMSDTLVPSALIKYIVTHSKLLDIFTYLGDIDQRAANIEKLIEMSIAFEANNSGDLYIYLQELEKDIYFNKDLKEDEAFYKSENVESVELCTIHSTKGLAYPMVVVAQSEKGLSANASGEMGLSFNSFTLKGEDYSGVGYKLGEYEPLIYRILKKISSNKHEAEKKRLLYVALTRAQHNLVIAGSLYEKSDGTVGLSTNSYLSWISSKAFALQDEVLFEDRQNDKIEFVDRTKLSDVTGEKIAPESLESVIYEEQEVTFKQVAKEIASNAKEHTIINEHIVQQATLGTAIHSVIQRYWHQLEDDDILQKIYLKYGIFDEQNRNKMQHYIANFKTTSVYKKLQSGVTHHFEMELNSFELEKQTQGIIDLLYFDEKEEGWVIVDFKSNNVSNVKDLVKFAKEQGYDKQLDTYAMLCESKGMRVVDKMLLWLDRV